jgi:DNA polymerase III alpha subunit
MAIKGLSNNGIEAIMNERLQNSDFVSLENFGKRVRISRDDIVALVPSGVFDSISNGKSRALQARVLLSLGTNAGKKHTKQSDLFTEEASPAYPGSIKGRVLSTPAQSFFKTAKRLLKMNYGKKIKLLDFCVMCILLHSGRIRCWPSRE